MDNLGQITINLHDDEGLEEYFSRKEPGGTCKFIIEASLDEIVNKSATLSLKNVAVKDYAEPSDDDAGEESETESALAGDTKDEAPAVKMMSRDYEA